MTTPDDEETALAAIATRTEQHALPPAQLQEKTLLPAPIASCISFVAKTSLVSLRLGSFLGGLAIDGARVGTLTGLELSRAVLETVFLHGGKEVASRSRGQLGRSEAENVLERSMATLHSTVTQASFLVSSGFHLSSAALSSASTLSSHLLSALDAILGSTESSRAIASIVTLIRREFRNPETGVRGEHVGVVDLLVGTTGLALLQRWCCRKVQEDITAKGAEQIVWDVVVLDNGRRADVMSHQRHTPALGPTRPLASFAPNAGSEMYERALHDEDGGRPGTQISGKSLADAQADLELRHRLFDQLPPDAQVSIRTEVMTTKTITVEVTGAEPQHIVPPSGTCIVEENTHRKPLAQLHGQPAKRRIGMARNSPDYRVVFQTLPKEQSGLGMVDMARPHLETEFHGRVSELPEYESSNTSEADLPLPPKTVVNTPTAIPSESQKISKNAGRGPASSATQANCDLAKEKKSPITNGESNTANEKRQRKPPTLPSNLGRLVQPTFSASQKSEARKSVKSNPTSDKRSTFRRALKKGTSHTNLSGIFTRDENANASADAGKSDDPRPPWGSNRTTSTSKQTPSPRLPVPSKRPEELSPARSPQAPQRGNPNYFSSRDLGDPDTTNEPPRSPSRASFYSIHERRRASLVSQIDTFSIHSADMQHPGSPGLKSHMRTTSNMTRAQTQNDVVVQEEFPVTPKRRRSHAPTPSIYTLHTNNSDSSLVVAGGNASSTLDQPGAIMSLYRSGTAHGQFPRTHLVSSMSRFARFASASYGSSFLRMMGISSTEGTQVTEHNYTHDHHEHQSFSSHTRLPSATILLSSFVDPQGGTNAAGETNSGVPLIHFVSLDHESKAIVLTCRGTLGFEDVLADMTCDYDEMIWGGQSYNVHKGIHASARRLLEGGGGRVMATIKAALEEFPEYGLVMCGHSLGGGVATLLATMISEQAVAMTSGSAFLTASSAALSLSGAMGGSNDSLTAGRAFTLPQGRPIHVFAYGPPAVMSPSLRLATRGLVTTVVNGQDVVPYLSLGTLHDMQGVALAFKTDTSNAKGEVRRRVWEGLKNGLLQRIDGHQPEVSHDVDDQWSYSALKSLRASMLSPKLVPPGEVFVVETEPVLQRDAFSASRDPANPAAAPTLGRPARRAMLRYIRDVEGRFGELRFGASMLGDHSPARYEANLATLERGVIDRTA